MDSYINLDIAVATLQNSHERRAENLREEALLAEDIRLLKEIPAADVRPVVRGQWLHLKDSISGKNFCACSECLETPECFEPYFCPNCGADMRGGKEE